MRLRFYLAPLLALISAPTACYETKLIDDLSLAGGAGAIDSAAGEAGSLGTAPSDAGAVGPGDAGAFGTAGEPATPGAAGEAGTARGGNPNNEAGADAGGQSNGGNGGSGGRAANGGRAASGGTTAGGENNAGGTATGGGTGGNGASGAGGTGGSTPLPGVTWLSFENSAAPSTLPPNDEFAINGELYAYADDCAELNWDPITRCASGVLCEAGPNFQNWGIAVGFYFNTTGATGTPPNRKITWDPSEIGVESIAWRISGTAPSLQLWVLNMDPAFGGECAEDSCEIIGAPDGTSTAALTGQLSFSRLHKDDWNDGIDYTFDPVRRPRPPIQTPRHRRRLRPLLLLPRRPRPHPLTPRPPAAGRAHYNERAPRPRPSAGNIARPCTVQQPRLAGTFVSACTLSQRART